MVQPSKVILPNQWGIDYEAQPKRGHDCDPSPSEVPTVTPVSRLTQTAGLKTLTLSLASWRPHLHCPQFHLRLHYAVVVPVILLAEFPLVAIG